MKKTVIIAICIAAGLFTLFVVARLTHVWSFYSMPSTSMKPTINTGDKFMTSNLVKPERFDLIVFSYKDSMYGPEYRVHRLCGLPGDTVEIRNGDLFVNNRNTSAQFDLLLPYRTSTSYTEQIVKLLTLEDDEIYEEADHLNLLLSYASCNMLRNNKIPFERNNHAREYENESIKAIYGQDWNEDHFGPYVVPADHYFVLGDNRHRAADSRYTGPIPKRDFKGTVISK